MKAAAITRRRPKDAKLLILDSAGVIRHRSRSRFASEMRPGDLVVANDAATIPASLQGIHGRTRERIEVRLAAWGSVDFDLAGDLSAIVFGRGDHRTPTEDRPAPPLLRPGDRLHLGPLQATVLSVEGHPRLIRLNLGTDAAHVWSGIARHGRPIQYSHLAAPLELWDVQTQIAARPAAFEPPSAGFSLDWTVLEELQHRGVGFATLTHAAGISSTGDSALDARLPLDEPYHIPKSTARAIAVTKSHGGRIVAVGTTVVRALEHSAAGGALRPGGAVASQMLGPQSTPRLVDVVISGVHEPGESHFELLRAFADDNALERMQTALKAHGYRTHEFGDSVVIERSATRSSHGCGNRPRGTEPRVAA